MDEYTSADIEKITGMKTRKIQFLVDYEIIEPKERGRGKPIIYTERNLIEIAMTQVLQDYKLTNLKIKFLFDQLRKGNRKGEFTDFFTNDDWGKKRELIHVSATVLSAGNLKYATMEVGMDYRLPKEIYEKIIQKAIGPITIIPIGKIKHTALKRLGIKS